MVTVERFNQEQESKEVVPVNPPGMVPAEAKGPAAPEGITLYESRELQARAVDLVRQLEQASGSKELEKIDSMSNLGFQAQRTAGTELDLLRVRMGDMMAKDGPGGEITKELVELRLALNRISPHGPNQWGLVGRVLNIVPFLGKLNPALKTLERIAIRYEPVSKQVVEIETRLREGRMMLARDNVELRQLYEQAESTATADSK